MRDFKVGESFLLKTDKMFWRDGRCIFLHPGQKCIVIYTNRYISMVDVQIFIARKVMYTSLLKSDLW